MSRKAGSQPKVDQPSVGGKIFAGKKIFILSAFVLFTAASCNNSSAVQPTPVPTEAPVPPPTEIPTPIPGGAIDVVSRPQIVFRGERLVVPSSIASFFALIDIKVGNRSQLANSTALPAQVFQENAVGVRLALDTAVVAQDIALIVENVSASGSAETFIAALIGTAAQ